MSIPGLPTQGSDVTILITKVHLHPLCVLVEFWGKFSQEKAADYRSLAVDIQSPGNVFQEFEGKPGDQCLAQIDGTWYRARIVSRNDLKYSLFLFDKGVTFNTTTSNLAWGKTSHFHLPPEVEYCLLANVLPRSPGNRWSPVALEFLKSLFGKSVKAHVQNVLVPQRTFILHIPCISQQMYEMGFAKKLSLDMFQEFVMSQQSHGGAQVRQATKRTSTGPGEGLHKQDSFMYLELPEKTVATVIVTEVRNPQQIFCQLKIVSKELMKLSNQITQCCEGRVTSCFAISPEMIGFPCAARASDGRWYRSVIQQALPNNKVVEVLNVDYGAKQLVQVENVKPLASEFFRIPVMTYMCSLYGIVDKGAGWTSSQIDYLKTLLLHKTVFAKFDYQSISDGVHYVTLYGEENASLNNLFGSKESCLLESEKALEDYATPSMVHGCQPPSQQERNQTKMLTGHDAVKNEEKVGVDKLQVEGLSLGSSHVAVVYHIADPSEFWIQTQTYAKEFDELMDNIYNLYKDSTNKDVVRNPTVGLYCVAKAEDGEFYRSTVVEVGETRIKVFFVDYGNTEMVVKSDIRILPDEFTKLPCLALKCSLGGIRPKDGRWSQSVREFFIRAVTDKTLNVSVTAKDKCYVVQLTDPEAEGEKDLATLMCTSGLAERPETPKQSKTKVTPQSAGLAVTQVPDTRLLGVCKNNGISVQALNTSTTNERRFPTFKEHMFPIGSVLDVNVSYIESPNDFWCQQVQNAWHLKLLMDDMQAHYAGSEFQPFVEAACVARHPDNGMWYRALVIHKHETPHVNVLFVDNGQTEMVSLYELRKICPKFLALRGQAFRCSLLNPADPTFATNVFSEEAVEKFHSFVETAAANFMILKCTFYAVMYSEQRVVYNIVDLETPFESISTSMTTLVKGAVPKKGPSFHLDTYYFSTHNFKTGTEKRITVTFVNNVSQFYCQLERNADVLKDLQIKVRNLCQHLEHVKVPTVFGSLCLAKYTDGQWYRGQIKATKPAITVHFVDYGDTIEVEKSDILPVPKEANAIMSVPTQAVLCGLSDVPADVPSEVNSWFEANATDRKFGARVVAREPDGKLLVELYHDETQINTKLKKMFDIQMPTEGQVVYPSQRGHETSANYGQNTQKVAPKLAAEMKDPTQTILTSVFDPKPYHPMRDANMNLQSASKLHHVCESGSKKPAPMELYTPPCHRQPHGRTPNNIGNGSEPVVSNIKPRKESPPTETNQPIKSLSPPTGYKTKRDAEKLPQLSDLPLKSITSGMEMDVYVSHCNSPLSFYVQFVREENELLSLVEKLNDPETIPQTSDLKEVHPGDLVKAEFADDSSWYRAVVKEIHGDTTALVEYVDFGNMATMPISKMARLDKSFLQLPMYSTHCMLSDTAALGKEELVDPKLMPTFKEDVSGDGEKVLKCRFISLLGSVWEVILDDNGVNVTCKAPERDSTDGFVINSETKEHPSQTSEIRQVQDNSYQEPPQCDSNIQGIALHEDKPEYPERQEMDTAVACIHSQTRDGEQETTGKPVDCQTADEALELSDSSKQRKSSEDDLHSQSVVESPEGEEDHLLTETNMATEPEILRTENLRETVSDEGMNIVPPVAVCQNKPVTLLFVAETLTCDEGVIEGTEEEGASDTLEPGVLSSLLEENPPEVRDDSEITTTDLMSQDEEVNTSFLESILDITHFFAQTRHKLDDGNDTKENSFGSPTTVKMVPRETAHPTADENSKELMLSSCVQPEFERHVGAGDDIPQEQVPCVATPAEADLLSEETVASDDAMCSAATANCATSDSEPHACTAASHCLADGLDDFPRSVEEASTNVFTDPNEASDESDVTSADSRLSNGAKEEMVRSEGAGLFNTEPQDYTVICPELNSLVEEVTCLVGEICLTDVCRGPQEAAETVVNEELLCPPSTQTEDSSGGVLEVEAPSCADDSFEARLPEITHLSLIINDSAADLLAKQQPEE